jgi:hypothetical protein
MDSRFVWSPILLFLAKFISAGAGFYALIEGLRRYRNRLALHPDGGNVAINLLGLRYSANLKIVGAVVILSSCTLFSLAGAIRPIAHVDRTEGDNPRLNQSNEQRPEHHMPGIAIPAAPFGARNGQIRE